MTDPRWRRAQQLREQVLVALAAGPLAVADIDHKVQRAVPFPVTIRQLDGALTFLRTAGRVRYVRPRWELVTAEAC